MLPLPDAIGKEMVEEFKLLKFGISTIPR